MNLSLARPQQRNQAGSEPNLHGWAELGLGPGSFGTRVNKGPSADLLILVGGEGDLPGDPKSLLALCPMRSAQCLFKKSLSFC